MLEQYAILDVPKQYINETELPPKINGRQKWDIVKIIVDNSSKEKYEVSMNELADAVDAYYEPFSVVMELKMAEKELLQLRPGVQPQAYPVTGIWLKRPAIKNEVEKK